MSSSKIEEPTMLNGSGSITKTGAPAASVAAVVKKIERKTAQKKMKKASVSTTFFNGNAALRDKMQEALGHCKKDRWVHVLHMIRDDPSLGLFPMIMNNRVPTTIMHQAITSRGDTVSRKKVIEQILLATPQAAGIRNGFGSLPLHVIGQRNTKMDAPTKEKLMFDLVQAYSEALSCPGGKGKRTPLHVLFTDYVSEDLASMMISRGPEACFMKDKDGYLPIHVACSRHCSPAKLDMMLKVNPDSIVARTVSGIGGGGKTPLMLARETATKMHPNNRLITVLEELTNEYLQKKTTNAEHVLSPLAPTSNTFIAPVSPDINYSIPGKKTRRSSLLVPAQIMMMMSSDASVTTDTEASEDGSKKKRSDENKPLKKRHVKTPGDDAPALADGGSNGNEEHHHQQDPVGLLLHFSRNALSSDDDNDEPKPDAVESSNEIGVLDHVEV